MARRNIAKTATEGGRVGICRELEREEDRYNRRVWRKFCRDSIRDDEASEPAAEILIGGWDRYRQGREFADKLNPVRRWLQKQVGRHWNDVRSEIGTKFDNRSLAGRHVLEHIESDVDLPCDPSNVSGGWVDEDGVMVPFTWKHKRRQFYVDARGILRIES